MDYDEIMKAKLASFCERCDALQNLSSSQVGELTKASISDPWTQEQKLSFARIFDARAELATQASSKSGRRGNQKCNSFENFIAEEKWVPLKSNTTTTSARQHILADVAASINIVNPDQPTLYRMGASIAHCEKNYSISHKDVFACMDRIQDKIKTAKQVKDEPC